MSQAGRYRDRGTIERATSTNARGVQQRDWAPVPTLPTRLPIQVETATAARLERLFPVGDGGRIEGVQTHVVTVRGRLPVQLQDRVRWHEATGDRFLEIVALHTLGVRRDVMVLGCEERER